MLALLTIVKLSFSGGGAERVFFKNVSVAAVEGGYVSLPEDDGIVPPDERLLHGRLKN